MRARWANSEIPSWGGGLTYDASSADGGEAAGSLGAGPAPALGAEGGATSAPGEAAEVGSVAEPAGASVDWTERSQSLKLFEAKVSIAETRPDHVAVDGELPSEIPAALSLSFMLDPSSEESGGAVRPGDWFAIGLPEAATPVSGIEEIEEMPVYAVDEQGAPAERRIATAAVVDGSLRVTFVAPDGQSQDAALEAPINGTVSLPVTVEEAQLSDDEPTEALWMLRNTPEGPHSETLALPSRNDIRALWGMTVPGTGAAAQAPAPVAGEPSIEWDYKGAGPALSITTNWADNNNSGRPALESVLPGYDLRVTITDKGGNAVTYSVWSEPGTPNPELVAALNLDAADIAALPTVSGRQTSTGTYLIETQGAMPTEATKTVTTPQVDEEGNPLLDEDGNPLPDLVEKSSYTLSWSLTDANTYANYQRNNVHSDGADGVTFADAETPAAVQYLQLLENKTFTFTGKMGDKSVKDFVKENLDKFAFTATVNGSSIVPGEHPEGQQTITLADFFGELYEGDVNPFEGCWEDATNYDKDSNTFTLSGLFPVYDHEGNPIVYGITYTGEQGDGTTESEDYYQPIYDNSGTPSHGGDVTAMYSGGTLTLVHAGTTSYDGYKMYYDGDISVGRPELTFTLWRYTAGSGPETASQVRLSGSENILPLFSPDSNAAETEYVEITIPAGYAGENPVDLGKLLAEKYTGGSLDLILPKYDPDGNPYIYCLRESMNGSNYEQLFGTVDENGNVTGDMGPNYEGADGPVFVDWERTEGDRFIYNGGTVSNRLTDTVSVEATKTWQIAAFQDELYDPENPENSVEVELTAQARPVSQQGDEDAWRDVEGSTVTLTGFSSEELTRTHIGSFPRYDSQGNELEYRWVETNVTQGGEPTNFTRNADGTASFQLTFEVSDYVSGDASSTETLDFTSTVDEDGIIVNTFTNKTDQHVDKLWQQDANDINNVAQVKPNFPGMPASTEVTVHIYRDGVEIGSATLDGEVDDAPTVLGSIVSEVTADDPQPTSQEKAPYHLDFENLPKYAPDGHRYQYLVIEEDNGWHQERAYDPITRTTTITNTVGPGEASIIPVVKEWVDGSDAQHRLNCVVNVYAKHDMRSAAENADGTPKASYQEGDLVATMVLSDAYAWYQEFEVAIGDLDADDFYIEEVGMTSSDEHVDDDPVYAGGGIGYESLIEFPAYTMQEAIDAAVEEGGWGAIGKGDWDWVNPAWTNEDASRIPTEDQVYELSYGMSEDYPKKALKVANRRIGLIDLTAEKVWNDNLGDLDEGDERNTRTQAQIVLSIVKGAGTFTVDEEGFGYVQLEGSANNLPILDETGGNVKGELTEDGCFAVNVDTAKEKSTYQFFGLPKYNGKGESVFYEINERWLGEMGDYTTTTTTTSSYTVGKRHYHDTQTDEFVNGRTGTRDVTFYKRWKDAYVYENLNQRPDIYLTLYQVSKETEDLPGGYRKVDGYIEYSWSPVTEGESTDYHQMCVISGLPKYDKFGDEITYYATEKMDADAASYDYQPVMFARGHMPDEEVESGEALLLDTEGGNHITEPEVADVTSGSKWAVHEDGEFVNRVEGKLFANGEKIWTNTGGYPEADVPELTIYLQQKLATESAWPSMKLSKDEGAPHGYKIEGGYVAETSDLRRVDDSHFTYTIWHTGVNKFHEGSTADAPVPEGEQVLPLYNEDGVRYEYRAREVIWGVIDSPANADADFDGVDIASDEESLVSEGIYVIQHGDTGSFKLNNVYQPEKAKLTVKKLFDGRAQGDHYPDVTFELWRTYDSLGTYPAEKVGEHTIKASEFGTDANGSATYTFEDLDIYAPTGGYWKYYVVERSIDGYKTTVGVGDLSLGSADLGAGTAAEGGVQSPDAMKDGESLVVDDDTVDITFANEYEPEPFKLTGEKQWMDYDGAFGERPESLKLRLSRVSDSGQEEIWSEMNGVDVKPGDTITGTWGEHEVTFTCEQGDDDSTWKFTVEGLEVYAPDGSTWEYRLSEILPNGTGYRIMNGNTAGEAGDNASDSEFKWPLQNVLEGNARVEKTWSEDGDDAYGLRPDSVTVQLWAATYNSEGEQVGDIEPAWNLLAPYLQSNGGAAMRDGSQTTAPDSEADFTYVLSDKNDWSHLWASLPLTLRQDDGSTLYIAYGVAETKIGDVGVSFEPSFNRDKLCVDFTYEGTFGSHKVSAETSRTEGDINYGIETSVALDNALEHTSIEGKKVWNDGDNIYHTRPGSSASSDAWSVAFLLQRTTREDGSFDSWEWVTEYGSALESKSDWSSWDDPSIVSVEITNKDEDATAKFENLPKYDNEGNQYRYRLVEVTPKGYTPGNGSAAYTDPETGDVLWVVDATQESGIDSYSFKNDLVKTQFSGTKTWEDYGTGFTPDFSGDSAPNIQLKLYRKAGESGVTEGVTYQQNGGQPTWSKGEDGTWTYTYMNLPKYDQKGVEYIYWALEEAGSVEGFYPAYPEGDTGNKIVNTATRFTLDKVCADAYDGEALNGVELTITGEGGKTFAVWSRDEAGQISSKVWRQGTDDVSQGGAEMTGDNAGWIVGLPAGGYTITETKTPTGHVTVEPIGLQISAEGVVALPASPSHAELVVEGANPGGTITIKVKDEVFRGHVNLKKTLDGSGGLEGVSFDLYRVGEPDVLIAKDIVTGADGTWKSVDAEDIELIAGDDAHHTTLADGLLPGEYYFVETSVPGDVHLDEGNNKVPFTIVAGKPATVEVEKDNTSFASSATLAKYDATTGSGIKDAHFKLGHRAADDTWTTVAEDIATASDGTLRLSFDRKGAYRLTEVANAGYDMADPFQATFTIDDGDFNGAGAASTDPLDFNDAKVREAHDWQGSVLDERGIPNERLKGAATLLKTGDDGSALDGAVFELQQRIVGGWVPVAEGLVTGKAYAYSADGTKEMGDNETGRLSVSNLEWGTYKFVEVQSADGFVIEDGTCETAPFTIDREAVAAGVTIDAGKLVNPKTAGISLIKMDETGEKALSGAEFVIEGKFADGSTSQVLEATESAHLLDEGLLVTGESYTVRETKAPAGYKLLDDALEFTVEKDGAITYGDLPEGWAAGEDGYTFTAKDAPIEFALEKVDEQGRALDGATFTIEGTFVDGTTARKNISGNTSLSTELVAGNAYKVIEVKAPDGYTMLEDAFEFTVDANGSATVATEADGYTLSSEGGVITVKATDAQTELDIAKVSTEGASLGGATFEVAGTFADGAESPIVLTTGADGKVDASQLRGKLIVGKEYTITETKAPAGYELIADALTVMVNADGTLEVVGDSPDAYSIGDGTVTVTVTDTPITMQLVKKGEGGTQNFGGAKFELAPAEGFAFADGSTDAMMLVTDEGGVAEVEPGMLVAGSTYVVREIQAPAGYELIEGVFAFEVGSDGAIAIAGEQVEGYTIDAEAEEVALVVSDAPIELQVMKQNADGDVLPGAVFALSGAFADGSTELVLEATGEDGIACVPEGMLVGESVYTLAEITAPAGYEVAGSVELMVGADGSIELADDGSDGSGTYEVTVVDGSVVLTAVDEPIAFKLVKTNIDGVPLAGAEFVVKPAAGSAFADGSAEVRFATDERGEAALVDALLVAGGTYTVEEEKAPEGYEVIAGAFSFTVAADGTIAPTADSTQAVAGQPGYRVADDGVSLQAFDEETPKLPSSKLEKTGDGAPLLLVGAVTTVAAAFLALATRKHRRRTLR